MGPPRPGSRRCALFCGRFLPRVCTVSYGEENSPLTSADLYLSLTHISLSRAETRCTTSARAHTHTTHCTETLGLESAAGAHMPAHALTYNRSWLYSAVHTLEPCSARSEPHLVLRHATSLDHTAYLKRSFVLHRIASRRNTIASLRIAIATHRSGTKPSPFSWSGPASAPPLR